MARLGVAVQVVGDISANMARIVAHLALVATPDFLLEAQREQGLSAARWRIGVRGIRREPISHHVLTYHTQSGTTMTRVVDGVRCRRTPRIGSVTLVRATDRVEWSWDRPLDVIHVYIHPDGLSRFAQEQLHCSAPPQLHDFFAIEDPWLAGYFQMLLSECEHFDINLSPASSQFLEETEPLLLRHLIRWHSDFGAAAAPEANRSPAFNPLRPAMMRRIEEHVRTHLGETIHLASLAAIANMSVDHFLRSFRAAAGTTPYQYILGLRLAKAATLLREAVAPIATVAAQCGFHSASHFSASFSERFGIRPSQYRRSA
jgi:AraC family transcriptional regulator